MKIEIFGAEVPCEKVLRLKLYSYDGRVTVTAVDENGEKVSSGNLITFEEDGTTYLHGAINRDLGLKLATGGVLDVSGSRHETH